MLFAFRKKAKTSVPRNSSWTTSNRTEEPETENGPDFREEAGAMVLNARVGCSTDVLDPFIPA
jgi:hypothetical protein